METLQNIRRYIKSHTDDVKAYEDYFQYNRSLGEKDRRPTLDANLWLRGEVSKKVKENKYAQDTIKFYDLLKRTYLWGARDRFSDYMVYLEWDRKPEERFYLPRARVLKPLVKHLQMLADDELDELFLSQPPRTGKTTAGMFYLTWLMGRDSERSNLYSAYSSTITDSFYDGIIEVMQDNYTYHWQDIFPERKIVSTDGKDTTINLDRRKRYASLTCRSLYSTLNGACDANGIILSDDLIGGIEEALNKDRMTKAWTTVDNNLLPRAKEGCKLLWWGTRWSMGDPAGRRMDTLETDKRFSDVRYKILNLPALNEKGESNFDYDYGVGFSTKYYQMRKASFEKNDDLASWQAQYQGRPVERGNTLFDETELHFFNGELPDEATLVRRFMAVDPAFGGGDYVAAPICYQYEDGSVYVVDVVYSNEGKNFTQPLLARKIVEWEVQAAQFECTKATASFKEKVEELLRENYDKRINITYKAAPVNVAKEIRIYDKAPDIRENFYFLEGSKRSRAYEQAMQNLFSFQISGRNKHDDFPDSLAMAVEMLRGTTANIKVSKRWF